MPATDFLTSVTTSSPMSWQPHYDGRSAAYEQWRSSRLKRLELVLESTASRKTIPWLVPDETARNSQAKKRLCETVAKDGYALYQWYGEADKEQAVLALMHQDLGLEHTDTGVLTNAGGFSVLEDMAGSPRARFVPYSNKQMNWHTDGYYNDINSQVRCFTLHCSAPAAVGGSLSLLDTELLLLALYDDDPRLVTVLSHPQAMTLPANKDSEGHNRPDRAVPVLFQQTDGSLGTRFTTRIKNIRWRCNETQAAAERAAELIETHQHWHTQIRLSHGQGIITRNILHRREAFEDAPGQQKRRMLRGRYLSVPRVQHPGLIGE